MRCAVSWACVAKDALLLLQATTRAVTAAMNVGAPAYTASQSAAVITERYPVESASIVPMMFSAAVSPGVAPDHDTTSVCPGVISGIASATVPFPE